MGSPWEINGYGLYGQRGDGCCFMVIDARRANGMMVVDLWLLMPDGQREMMVAGFFMIIDARWANQRIRLMKFPFFSP